jgi:uncharacterized coiled-coil protein SlyX
VTDQRRSDIDNRVSRLEEAQAYAERSIEQLNDEMVELGRRMTDILARLQRLEATAERLTDVPVATKEASAQDPPLSPG